MRGSWEGLAESGSQAFRQMFSVRSVDSDTFFAVSVVAAVFFLTGTVIFYCIFRAEGGGKCFLQLQAFCAASQMKEPHSFFFCFISFDNHTNLQNKIIILFAIKEYHENQWENSRISAII